MTSAYRDHLGRPRVAVTGMGIVTSLGRGKADNWDALSGGRSGIHRITRFATEGLSTTIAGTVEFVDVPLLNATELSFAMARESTVEALDEAGLDGDFGGPLFLAAPPIEPEWSMRFAYGDMARAIGADGNAYERFTQVLRQQADPGLHEAVLFGSISERLAERFGTRGLPITLSTACASGATAIQLGVEAIRQGRTERALTVATDGSVTAESLIRFSLLSALSTQNDPPEKAGIARKRGGAWRDRSGPSRRLRRKGGSFPSHPLVARWRPGDRDDPRGVEGCGPRCRRHRLYQRPRHLDARKRQDGISVAFQRVR
jgi:3-oxoacyl-[acyl-carrier-protein] synthase II